MITNQKTSFEWEREHVLAVVSHELRTPVTAILGWAQLLQKTPSSSATLVRGLEVIEQNARIQSRLIEQLLDFSRPNATTRRRSLQKISLAIVLEDAIDAVTPLAERKEIDLRLLICSSTCVVLGEPVQLQQVVTNLLSNAIKFSPVRGRVDVALCRLGTSTIITVRDSGCGINPDLLPHIFDPFKRGESATSIGQDGLGLGLTIARQIVASHGGQITAESSGEAKGSTFKVRLPLAEEK